MGSRADIEPNLKKFQEMISKYQFMEVNTTRRAAGLRDKIPDIRKTLDTVVFLSARKAAATDKPFEAFFELNDTLYAKAAVPAKTDEVFLWLGVCAPLPAPAVPVLSHLSYIGECYAELPGG